MMKRNPVLRTMLSLTLMAGSTLMLDNRINRLFHGCGHTGGSDGGGQL